MTNRQPKGTPIGGQFAEGRKPDGGDIQVVTDRHKIVSAIYDVNKGRGSLQESVDLGVSGLNNKNYYGSVLDDDHIADAKSFLAQGHTQLAQISLQRGDSASAAKHLAAAHAAITMPDPDHGDSAQEIYDGARRALIASDDATTTNQELNEIVAIDRTHVRVWGRSHDIGLQPGCREWYEGGELVAPPVGTEINVAEARALPSGTEVMATFEVTGDREYRLMARDLPRYSDDEHPTDASLPRRFTNLDTGFEVFIGSSEANVASVTKIVVVSHG